MEEKEQNKIFPLASSSDLNYLHTLENLEAIPKKQKNQKSWYNIEEEYT